MISGISGAPVQTGPSIWVHDTFLSRPRLARPVSEDGNEHGAARRYRLRTSANHPKGERGRRTVERRLSSTAHRMAASPADSGRSRRRDRAARSDPKGAARVVPWRRALLPHSGHSLCAPALLTPTEKYAAGVAAGRP